MARSIFFPRNRSKLQSENAAHFLAKRDESQSCIFSMTVGNIVLIPKNITVQTEHSMSWAYRRHLHRALVRESDDWVHTNQPNDTSALKGAVWFQLTFSTISDIVCSPFTHTHSVSCCQDPDSSYPDDAITSKTLHHVIFFFFFTCNKAIAPDPT